jgi:hypothetical protein
MKTITLTATFDGERIRLEDDFPLTKNARLLVTVLPDDDAAERRDWLTFASQSLARAYGDNEPDYPDSCVKEPNPLYEGR